MTLTATQGAISDRMKKCIWCGKEYPDEAERCVVDEQPLRSNHPEQQQLDRPAETTQEPVGSSPLRAVIELVSPEPPKLINLNEIDGAFEFREGYSRPNWNIIRQEINNKVPADKLSEAWTEAALQWAQELSSNLGKEYHVRSSDKFILVSALALKPADRLLVFAETILERIYTTLGDAAWKSGMGKHVLFLFAETDDYYQYVSFFNAEGIHPTSSGCLIAKGGYVHIAMPYLDGRHLRQALTHELVHNSVAHLHLPLWLNEGLACLFQRTVAEWSPPILDHELRDAHLAFWTPGNIQKFWSGVSFQEPGESNKLSYGLAEILVQLLSTEANAKKEDFAAFVKEADWHDAGQTAALDILQRDLGQVMGTFLGEGYLRPSRKAIIELWNTKKREQKKPEPEEQ
jgi:hypothetical protein